MVNGKGIVLASFALTLGAFTQPALADVNQTGIASYYWQGRGTASGERFNANALTAAHRSLPFNTKVKVTNLRNGRSVIVRINDRGPFIRGRIIDVSRGAAAELGFTGHGITRVSLSVLGRDTETASNDETSGTQSKAAAKSSAKQRTQVASLTESASSAADTSSSSPRDNGGWTLVPSPSTQTAEASKGDGASSAAQ